MIQSEARQASGRAGGPASLTLRLLPMVILMLLAASCSPSAGAGDVEAAYKSFAAAVLADEAGAFARRAPFLAGEGSGTALEALKETLRSKPPVTVRMTDDANAEAVLSDPKKTVIPFRKNASGAWVVSDQITRTRHIDFIPAR